MAFPEIDDKKIIQQYLQGDEKSLEILIAKYLKPIYSFVYKNIGGINEAEDITQEVFVRVWKNLKKFDQNKSFKTWIFTIAKNASIDFLRKKKSIPFSRFENEKGQNPLTENIAAPSLNLLEVLNNKDVVKTAISGLSGEEKKIIKLRHDKNLTFREIAELLKESVNTVKSKYRRAILFMRKNIKT